MKQICVKCLKELNNPKKIKIKPLGYGSLFDECGTEFCLCEDCYNEHKEWWDLEQVVEKELFEKFDTRLKAIDEEYQQNLSIPNYILMIVARITELKKEEQNQIGLYLFNIINTFGKVNVLKKINYNSY